MTRIDFYVLSDSAQRNRLDLICRLAEKAAGQKQRVFIYGPNRQVLVELDQLLWSFRALSFVPHQLVDTDQRSKLGETHKDDPVLLSDGNPGMDRTVLVNLDNTVPPFFSRFERTLEIVNRQPDVQRFGRERYLYYKHRGYPLQHHPM